MNTEILDHINANGLILFGCGKMGGALLRGWLEAGIAPASITVLDPHPAQWLQDLQKDGLKINAELAPSAVCILAVKPQIIAEAGILHADSFKDTIFISVAAGTTLGALADILGEGVAIVRTMPNTPAAIGQGITALIGNDQCSKNDLDMASAMLETVGQVVLLEDEAQMDAVTGVSGSGPAYVFHFIECLAAAAEEQGLSRDIAMQLAKATIAGAGALAQSSPENVGQLRENVTSPGGTTAAGLNVLMQQEDGLPPLIKATVQAAVDRSRELGA